MYQVIYNNLGPKKNSDNTFCVASSRCAKCPWFVEKKTDSIIVFGKKKTVQTAICNFNKKPYDDMRHKLTIYKNGL
jgi:hypothetical protein